ncbi:MAG TPA: 2-phospho-L-lactate guanylyltransferase [Acidimicrobiia bacterium]|nr:2-phospho-L-lactate guanylyltransferase [Acidimicrobiia bacterium]
MVDVVIGIPVKPFPAAKRRLAAVLDSAARARLGRSLAERTVRAVLDGGGVPLVLSADASVTAWARSMDVDVLLDEGSSLDQAAHDAVRAIRARSRAWAILHADLPTLTGRDLRSAFAALAEGACVLAPSSDGGTSLVGSSLDHFAFSYGPGSFHRHLTRLAPHSPRVVVNRGLALDLDTPDDLRAAAATAGGEWLSE